MREITRSVHVNASPAEVWARLSDVGNVCELSPTIAASELTSENPTGIGATRRCRLTMMGAELDERVDVWDENEHLGVHIYAWSGMPGVTAMRADFRLHGEDAGTRLRATISYDLGMGWVGAAMNKVALGPMMARNWSRFVAGIKHGVETGQPVRADTQLTLAGVVGAG